MINGKSVTAIILVAGNSTRFGKNKNKILSPPKNAPFNKQLILTFLLSKIDTPISKKKSKRKFKIITKSR